MPSTFLLWDRIRALASRHRIYQAERTLPDQHDLNHVAAASQYLAGGPSTSILDQTELQLHRLERYRDVEQMDQTGEIALALDLYADEAALLDAERKHTLIIRAHSRRLKRELEELFFNTLLWDNNCRPAVRYLCKYGDFPAEIVPNKHRTGVSALRFMSVYHFTRIETRHGDLVGFFYQEEDTQQPLFLHPWQVMHLRLTSFENSYAPYGRAVIDGGRKAFHQLRLMEEAALIYRITRAAEKRVFKLPVGNIPAQEVPQYVQMIARTFKRRRFYNATTGTFDERYSPLVQEDDIFLPIRADGVGPEVNTLPGAQNLGEIGDIEYFKKRMIAPTKIPFARVGIGEGAGEANEKSLSQSSAEFAKAVQWIQREMVTGLTKVAICHLALRGYPIEDIKGFELAMSATSAMEELYRMETWQTRTGVMMDLKELGWFPKSWIITHFTDLTPDEIEELKELEAAEVAVSGGGEGGGGGMGGGGFGGGGDDLPPLDQDDPLGVQSSPGGMPGSAVDQEGAADQAGMGGPSGLDLGAEPQERWDRQAQQQLLQELKLLRQRGDRQRYRALLEQLSRRLGKDRFGEAERPITNGFDYLLEAKEIDGLSRTAPTRGQVGTPYNPNKDAGILVEWSVPQAECKEVITEVRQVLCEDAPAGVAGADAEPAEITMQDLPPLVEVSGL